MPTTEQRARYLVSEAVRRGELVPEPCEACGYDHNIHAHHDDYTKPLAVRWLCPGCHKKHHNALRAADGTLKVRKGVRLVKGVRLSTVSA